MSFTYIRRHSHSCGNVISNTSFPLAIKFYFSNNNYRLKGNKKAGMAISMLFSCLLIV